MDKRFLIGVCTGMAILGIVTYLPSIAEAIYSVPPTNAIAGFRIDDNATYTLSNDTAYNATSYKDLPWLISDGSINIEIAIYP